MGKKLLTYISFSSEACIRENLWKRRKSIEINIAELPETIVRKINQQRAAPTNVTEIDINKKNTLKDSLRQQFIEK